MAVITSDFGRRRKPCPTCSEDHKGVDLRAPVGSPIYANQDLTVSRVADTGSAGYGKALYVKDPNNPNKEYVFGHLDDNNPDGSNKAGATIKKGSIIGYTGATGANEQPHLHYEVRQFGIPIAPYNDAGIVSFSKTGGNILTTTAVTDKNRPQRPTVAPVAVAARTLSQILAAREQEKNKTGPGSNLSPRPTGSNVGILINPRHSLHDGS